MKNLCIYIYGLFFLLLITVFLPSCKKGMGDFLDKAPGVDITEDTIFSSQREIETFVATMYRYGLPTTLPLHDAVTSRSQDYFQLSSAASDEGALGASWGEPHNWNHATINSTNINYSDDKYESRWKGIRIANTLLKRINEGNAHADAAYLNQVSGEAHFIRAYAYFEMFKRYGGEPITAEPLTSKEVLSTLLHRSSIKSMVDFMVKDCDDAAAILPDYYPSNMRGRVTKGAALMLKSKILLFAASPLFNTGDPYLSLGANDSLICYGDYDKSRWQKAADAAKAVIDWAPSGNIHLITEKGDENYEYMWSTPDNEEIILANKTHGPQNQWGFPWYGILPSSVYNGYGGVTVTFNFQKLYEKKDGTPQSWDMNGGNDLNEMYDELDPRFAQTVAYNGSYWNSEYPNIQTYQGGAQATNCFGGAWQRKFVPRSLVEAYGNKVQPNNILMRLGEAYLNYAEALNEAQGPVQEAYDALNKIRNRSGMPDLPAGLHQDEFRKRVRNERAIELAFEAHRFADIRRWLVAKDLIDGDMWGLKISKIPGSSDFKYEPYVFATRTFLTKMYLYPFLYGEVNKGYIVQNPGW